MGVLEGLRLYLPIIIQSINKMKKILTLLLAGVLTIAAFAQQIDSPKEFLDYELGSQFTFHYKMVEYFKAVADKSPRAIIKEYGVTNEGRPLFVCFISSEKNIQNLETLRTNNLKNIGLMEGEASGDHIPFVWLAYNVHGNESVGMETAMKSLYELVTEGPEGSKDWLESCVIAIDPCQNPDGRDLYTNRYRRRQPLNVNPNAGDWSHRQGWPSARLNHYLFDLNRDWAWQTQKETKERIAFYNKYMPQVHADFHEMGSNSTYFFAPGADPWHNVITPWQHEFHKLTGEANAKLFNEKSRLYFSKESFDLFCPSFGDTWPLFNGAMGFTYEQGGGGSAGLAIARDIGDTLTLATRIDGHYMSTLATINAAYEVKDRLIKEFVTFFKSGVSKPNFVYKSIILKGSNNKSDIKSLLALLDANQIQYSYPSVIGKSYEGFDYLANKNNKTNIENGDILISAYQPQSHMVEVLFEPDSKLSDSLSYDLTGWALPYLYNVKAYALKEKIKAGDKKVEFTFEKEVIPKELPYAYLVNWTDFSDIRLMAELYKKKINVRYSAKQFTIGGNKYNRGSLIIARGDNKHLKGKFDLIVTEAANDTEVDLNSVSGGLSEKGIDLGSNYAKVNKAPSIAIVGGSASSTGSLGELWYYFENELKYPVTIIDSDVIAGADLDEYNVIFLPSGSYAKAKTKLMDYAKAGGRIIAFEKSISMFATDKSTNLYTVLEKQKKEKTLTEKKKKSDDPSLLKKYENQRREGLKNRSASSIYRVKLDETHPYVYGLGSEWFIMKRSGGYPYLSSGNNIAYITEKDPVSGFAGSKFIEEIANTIVIASERIGRGEVVYISDDPYYRAFWKSGRLLLGNLAFR